MPIMFARKPKPAQRGKTLERCVQSHLEKLAALKGYIWIRPDSKFRRSLGIYTDKQPADFLLLTGTKGVWLIECKECSEPFWYPERGATEYQRASIRKAQALGYNAGFLVWFPGEPTHSVVSQYRWITQTTGTVSVVCGNPWSWEYFYE